MTVGLARTGFSRACPREAEDGTRVGLRHVENIWLKTALGFRLDDDVCALLQGKRLVGVEVYTFDAKFVVAADLVIE